MNPPHESSKRVHAQGTGWQKNCILRTNVQKTRITKNKEIYIYIIHSAPGMRIFSCSNAMNAKCCNL